MVELERLEYLIREALNIDSELLLQSVAGGDIHDSFKVTFAKNISINGDDIDAVFVKRCALVREAVLRSEFDSLVSMASLHSDEINYPRPIQFHSDDSHALLIMSFHDVNPLTAATAMAAGDMLARQHQSQSDTFGWHQDNFIGLTSQRNTMTATWSEFYLNCRLIPQIELAARHGINSDLLTRLNKLCDTIAKELENHHPKPCVLHGDLWSGNIGYDQLSYRPILYDPAPYYGDPETDIAMTELFGSLPSAFYQTYRDTVGIADGYTIRKPIYHLYHALNHFNLFGFGYESMVERLIVEINNSCK